MLKSCSHDIKTGSRFFSLRSSPRSMNRSTGSKLPDSLWLAFPRSQDRRFARIPPPLSCSSSSLSTKGGEDIQHRPIVRPVSYSVPFTLTDVGKDQITFFHLSIYFLILGFVAFCSLAKVVSIWSMMPSIRIAPYRQTVSQCEDVHRAEKRRAKRNPEKAVDRIAHFVTFPTRNLKDFFLFAFFSTSA